MEYSPESKQTFEGEPVKYAAVYARSSDPASAVTSAPGEVFDGALEFMDTRQLSVNNTVADKVITVTIVKLTGAGEKDIPVATAEVPVDQVVAAF